MMNVPSATEVLGAMITPAVLISASGTLVLSTSNRLNRVVDRVRVLAGKAEQLRQSEASETDDSEARRQLLADQLRVSSSRALLLRSAMTSLYLAIGLLVTSRKVEIEHLLKSYTSGLTVCALSPARSIFRCNVSPPYKFHRT